MYFVEVLLSMYCYKEFVVFDTITKIAITIPQPTEAMIKDLAVFADLLASSYFISAASFFDCDRKIEQNKIK